MDWTIKPYAEANHPPVVRIAHSDQLGAKPGERVMLSANGSTDPDGQPLRFEWLFYLEAGTYRGPLPQIHGATGATASFVAPPVETEATLHLMLILTDGGDPPLTRYRRLVVKITPKL